MLRVVSTYFAHISKFGNCAHCADKVDAGGATRSRSTVLCISAGRLNSTRRRWTSVESTRLASERAIDVSADGTRRMPASVFLEREGGMAGTYFRAMS